jgi:hypothetical protein
MSDLEEDAAPPPPPRAEVHALDDAGGYFTGDGTRDGSAASLDSMGFDDDLDDLEDEEDEDDEGAGLDRIRALMLNFYGAGGDALDGEGDGDGNGGGGSGGGGDGGYNTGGRGRDRSMDIDHAAFDPAAYVLRAVRDDPLTSLLQADEALVSEVQELNNDMQNLVYENYNKFIDATDTIRKMKDQVEGMESEIELLIKTMDNVDTRTQEINARLQPKRNKIENMVSLQRLIKRLEFLFELPMRLKRSIELEAFSQAVKYFNMASGILEKYSDVASFGAIQVESKEIMSSLKSRIVASLEYRPEVRPSAISENMRLLIDLGDPQTELTASFFAWYKKRLDFRVGEIRCCLENAAAAVATAPDDTTRAAIMWGRNTAFLSDMNTFLESHGELFGGEEDGGSDKGTSSSTSGDSNDLKSVVQSMFTDYFGVMRSHLVGAGANAAAGDPVSTLLSLLEKFKSELRESSQLLRGRSLRMRLDDRAAEIMEHALRTQIVHTFQALKKSLVEHMASAVSAVEITMGVMASVRGTAAENDKEVVKTPEKSAPTEPVAAAAAAADLGNPFGDASHEDKPDAAKPSTGNPFGDSENGDGGAGNPFGQGEAKKTPATGNPFSNSSTISSPSTATETNEPSEQSTTPDNDMMTISSNHAKDSAHNLAALVRSTVQSLVSEIEATLNSLRPLLETTSSRRRGALLPGMDSVFLDLVRGEFESTVLWLASQFEQQCDHVGSDRPGRAIGMGRLSRGGAGDDDGSNRRRRDSAMTGEAGENNCVIFEPMQKDCLSVAFRENSRYVFAASCIFRELARGGISGPCDALEELYESISSDSAGGNLDASPTDATMELLNVRCGDCATVLLSHFVGLRSRFAVRSVRQRLDHVSAERKDADGGAEPHAIDDLAFIIVQGAREIAKDAHALLGRGGGGRNVGSSSSRGGSSSSVTITTTNNDNNDNNNSKNNSNSGGGSDNSHGGSNMQYRGRGAGGRGRDTTIEGGAMRNGPTPGNVAISGKGAKSKKGGGMSGLSLDIDRLFAKKVSVFSAPTFSCSSLLQEFFRVVFKSLAEHVRELTMMRAGFQEVQLIARFLFDMLPVFVGDDTEGLDALLAEFVNSAHVRCLDLAPAMNELSLDTVVNQAKSEQEEGGAERDAFY